MKLIHNCLKNAIQSSLKRIDPGNTSSYFELLADGGIRCAKCHDDINAKWEDRSLVKTRELEYVNKDARIGICK
jgi:hypothetical protein